MATIVCPLPWKKNASGNDHLLAPFEKGGSRPRSGDGGFALDAAYAVARRSADGTAMSCAAGRSSPWPAAMNAEGAAIDQARRSRAALPALCARMPCRASAIRSASGSTKSREGMSRSGRGMREATRCWRRDVYQRDASLQAACRSIGTLLSWTAFDPPQPQPGANPPLRAARSAAPFFKGG